MNPINNNRNFPYEIYYERHKLLLNLVGLKFSTKFSTKYLGLSHILEVCICQRGKQTEGKGSLYMVDPPRGPGGIKREVDL
jgi:hypothetical protein